MEHRILSNQQSGCFGYTQCSCGGVVLKVGKQAFKLTPRELRDLLDVLEMPREGRSQGPFQALPSVRPSQLEKMGSWAPVALDLCGN